MVDAPSGGLACPRGAFSSGGHRLPSLYRMISVTHHC
jgi:hypothetical protein